MEPVEDMNEFMLKNINIKNILVGWYRKLTKRKQTLAEYRLSICKTCPYKKLFLSEDICDLCGCVLDAKVRVENEICYDGRW